jgi:hypothetical protein
MTRDGKGSDLAETGYPAGSPQNQAVLTLEMGESHQSQAIFRKSKPAPHGD